ncbi:uncharacterized protein LOC114241257 [Bombyx mandarina]|uniref:Uncharacterized protein LOC114241257 n=1 Tax=Bombyx mandarina TaxID=7092 RepID=A0A6J2JED5_BOMMA|nr:uncharacterized protein LOC114241257 [Bombyx mandarina]
MVLADFLSETRRRWLKAFKLFKGNKHRKSSRNRVSPSLVRSPSYNGTVDARSEIDVHKFCGCRTSLPPLTNETLHYNSYNSSNSSRIDSLDSYRTNESRTDSAYDSARSSPARVCHATVTYFNVNDSEDSSSVRTEYTLLDDADRDLEQDESTQNIINESLELVSTL